MPNSDEHVIRYLIKILREGDDKKVVIEDFPLKKEYFNLFAKNGKMFTKLLYLECSDFECMKRMYLMDRESSDFIGVAKLNNLILEYEKKRDILNLIREKNNFEEIDANRDLNFVKQDVLSKVQPTIYMFKSSEKFVNTMKKLIEFFVDGFKYDEIDVNRNIYFR